MKVDSTMTLDEAIKDSKLMEEIVDLKKQGKEEADAIIEVAKKHQIDFNEDQLKAEFVGKMKLDDNALDNVVGGI